MGTVGESNIENQARRSYWRLSKQDFFPEESFQSWSNYKSALTQTSARFKDRLVSRSEEANELGEVRKQSENDMKRCLNWWDLMWFGFGSVIGAGIFVLTGQEAHNHAGPAIVLSYFASGVSAMLSVFCYTEFAIEIPVAGGSFAYLRVELGDFAAFVAAGNILLECIVGNAAVARAWTSYFTTLLNRHPNSLRIHTNLQDGYNLLDPIAVAVLIIASTIAMTSTRRTSHLNWIASAINNIVILFVIIAGFAHAKTSNLSPFLPHGAQGVFRAAAIVYFAYGGFDNIATCCPWCSQGNDHSSFGRSTWASALYYSYCTSSYHSSMVFTCPSKDRNSDICYIIDHHFWFMYRLLFRLRCSLKFVICQHSLHLYDDVSCTSCEEVLCERNNSSNRCLEAGYSFAAYHCFLYGNCCLLGFEP